MLFVLELLRQIVPQEMRAEFEQGLAAIGEEQSARFLSDPRPVRLIWQENIIESFDVCCEWFNRDAINNRAAFNVYENILHELVGIFESVGGDLTGDKETLSALLAMRRLHWRTAALASLRQAEGVAADTRQDSESEGDAKLHTQLGLPADEGAAATARLGAPSEAENDAALLAESETPSEPEAEPDVAERIKMQRTRILEEYKLKCARAGVKVTDEMIAQAANPRWNKRWIVAKWKAYTHWSKDHPDPKKAGKPVCPEGGAEDRAIRRVLQTCPHLQKPETPESA